MKEDCHDIRKETIEDAMIDKAEAKSHYVTLSEGGATANAVRAAQLQRRCDALSADLYEVTQRLRKAERELEDLGFRRCDIPACNCGGYHLQREEPEV